MANQRRKIRIWRGSFKIKSDLVLLPFVLRLFGPKPPLPVYTTSVFVLWFSFSRYLASLFLLQFLISDINMISYLHFLICVHFFRNASRE